MTVAIDDPKKAEILEEWFCESTSEFSFCDEEIQPKIKVKSQESANALHVALVDFCQTVNEKKGLLNGNAIPSPQLKGQTITLSQQWVDNLDVTQERGHDIEKIYNKYSLLVMGES